ncbi:MAG: DNA recombination protein RmuC [Bacteroidetes bacterium]|nr:DNA recombination protein RmuC [Bacteroidota bacterium]
MEIVLIFCGIAAGALLVWVLMKNRIDPQTVELKRTNAGLEAEKKSAADEVVRLRGELEREKQRFENTLKEERKNADELLNELRGSNLEFSAQLAREKEAHANLKTQLEEQKGQLEKLQERFTKEFELLANKIFEEKSQKFTDQNRTQLDILLQPLGEKLKDFEKKINDTHLEDTKERASLKEQLAQLHQLNQQMSTDAANLTRALKGDSQKRGAWGEYILTSILEKSGLVADREYKLQQSITTEENQRHRPDVIIYLPEGKHLVIDSKVSLVAYERYTSAETDDERTAALREHVAAVRKHINDLGTKNYQQLYSLNSLDFVLLFMPVEPAFAAALQGDAELFNVAFDKNIVIVSPSTLLATLRTVASIWRQENQNRNALEIARQSGKLYEKFVGFTEDLRKIGRKLEEAQAAHQEAFSKLDTGRGNLVRSAEKLKKLGARTTKSLSAEFMADDADDDDTEDEV